MESDRENIANLKHKRKRFGIIAILSIIALLFLIIFVFNTDSVTEKTNKTDALGIEDRDRIENGIHVRTGFVDGEGLMAVVTNCTVCHSAEIVIQNRMTKEGWNSTIKWMQETQNLWDLGANQELIVNYLVNNYPVYSKGRRTNLEDIEWYKLVE